MEEMSLEEAIDIIEDNLDEYINQLLDIYRYSHIKPFEMAIKKIIEELDRRIKPKVIEDKIKEYEGLKEMDLQAYEEQIKPLKELLNRK